MRAIFPIALRQRMKIIKTSLALAVSTILLAGCNEEASNIDPVTDITVSTYNLSFDRDTFEQLVDEMETTPEQQQILVDAFLAGSITGAVKEKAEKVIQIRNVAAVIQKNRPNVLMMGEFNNDGTGDDKAALVGFQTNYLSVAQSLNSIDGGDLLEPISYPYLESYSTNTGLNSGLDLDNNGTPGEMPGDAWGFGLYHGQYAFALMSQYKIDTENTRTFQEFKWKDLPSAEIPKITNCDDPKNPIPTGMSCGDDWYDVSEWSQVRLSSKNHVDAPIIVPTINGEETIHLLMSHPTPPVFDTVTDHNKMKNRDEIQFWTDYIEGAEYLYDDSNVSGGLAQNAKFVIMGDLNADPVDGDGYTETIRALLNHQYVNGNATVGSLTPTSTGAAEEHSTRTYPDRVTSTFGLRVDHAIPSSNLEIQNSGVYWPATGEEGRLLMNDDRLGTDDEKPENVGKGKYVSSDHRMVWTQITFD